MKLHLQFLKHNNACGVASREKLVNAWENALAGDPVSAFGSVLVTNRTLDIETAEEINKIFSIDLGTLKRIPSLVAVSYFLLFIINMTKINS